MISKTYEYIHMEEIASTGKTKKYEVVNNRQSDIILGIIKWNGRWRQYCFFPYEGMVFSTGCMLDIVEFIEGLK
jgi:hypothetical protein